MAERLDNGTQELLLQLQTVIDALHETLHQDSLEEALDSVVAGVRKVVGEEASAAITLLDSGGVLDPSTYRVDGPVAGAMRSERPRREGGIGAWVMEHNRAIYEEDVVVGETGGHPPIRQHRFPAGAYACLPLASRGKVLGTLFVLFQKPFKFTVSLKSSLDSFASIAAHTVELARLRSECEQEKEKQTQLVQHIGAQLLETWERRDPTGTRQNTLAEILRQVDDQVVPEEEIAAAVYIYEEERGFSSDVVRGGPLADYMRGNRPRRDGTAMYVVRSRRPLFVNDVRMMPKHVPDISDAAQEAGLQAFANIPLVIGGDEQGEVVGVLNINSRRPGVFSSERQEALTLFAHQAAITLQAARVHRRRLREQLALQVIGKAATTGSLQEAGGLIATQAALLTDADYASFWHLDEARSRLILEGTYSSGAGWPIPSPSTSLSLTEPGAESINRHVIEKEKPFYYQPDLTADPYHLPWDDMAKSAFCVPLSVTGELLGTLYLASERPDGFRGSHRQFIIDQLAPHAAIALHTARLLGSERTQRKKAEAFQSIVTEIHRSADLQTIGTTTLDHSWRESFHSALRPCS